jgi:hypothetical protein
VGDSSSLVSGVSAVSVENSPIANVSTAATGVSVVSSFNNPTAAGMSDGTATPAGVSVVSAVNTPDAVASVNGDAIVSGVDADTYENPPKGLAFAAAAGVGSSSSFTNPTIPAILLADVPGFINALWEYAITPEITVDSTALSPWTIESSAPWLTAIKVDPAHAYFNVGSEIGLPTTGYNGRVATGRYTGYVKITSGVNTLVVPIVYSVGYGDNLDRQVSVVDFPF